MLKIKKLTITKPIFSYIFGRDLLLCSLSSKLSQFSEVSCGTVFLCTGHRAESPAGSLPELPGFSFPEVWQMQNSEIGGPMNHSAFLMSLPCVMC